MFSVRRFPSNCRANAFSSVFCLVSDRGITVPVQAIHLRIPEIPVRFIHLIALLFLLLDRGQTFLFLVSTSRGLGGLTADQNHSAPNDANKLNVVHI